ncbi:hypothetical protein K6V92_23355 [Cupriavidus respiraculi]|nr:hypothetical protein [Cupriavidus respiraculi]
MALSAAWVVAAAPLQASEYGCRVLLCLDNPADNGGPKGVAACVPTIDRLYRDLHLGRPFPRCDEAGSDTYAVQVFDPYDPCPAPLQPAAAGVLVAPGRMEVREGRRRMVATGPARPSMATHGDGALGERACVGQWLGSDAMGDADSPQTVLVYGVVHWQPAQNPRAVDVFVDGRWQQRLHG